MDIKDLGDEAIDEILSEAIDGMIRRTGTGWVLDLHGEHGDLKIRRNGKHVTTANVRPYLSTSLEDEPRAPDAIRLRSALRRNILAATQAGTPVPGAADIPAALARTFSAIAALDAIKEKVGVNEVFGLGHDLYRILDHLTGNDHSGCSSAPSVTDFGRVSDPKPKRSVPLQADIDALQEAKACTDPDDGQGQAHIRSLQDTLDSLLADQRRVA